MGCLGPGYPQAQRVTTITKPKDYYSIKKASQTKGKGRRATFAIQRCIGITRTTLALEAVDAVNSQLKLGAITYEEAHKQVLHVRESLYKERDRHDPLLVFTSENAAVVSRYWKAEYADRDLVDADTMRADLERAIAAIGHVPLASGTREELKAALDRSLGLDVTKYRRVVARLNQLLRFCKRDFKLHKPRAVRKDVCAYTEEELNLILRLIKDPMMKLLCKVAYGTGLRAGEIFAMGPNSVHNGCVIVTQQLDKELKLRDTKTRTDRKAFIIPGYMNYVKAWISAAPTVKAELRTVKHSKLFKAACQATYPKDTSRHGRFHDLRHSYAVYLLVSGVPITLVANSLGNSTNVCEKYYSGFKLRQEGIDMIASILAEKGLK